MPSDISNISPGRSHPANSGDNNAKLRVDSATANLTGARCLVENLAVDEFTAPDYAHCLARKFYRENDFMTHLEFVWNMQRMSLQINSSLNIMRLSPKFHTLFDFGMWLLVPDEDIVEKFYLAADPKFTGKQVRESFDKANETRTSYCYTLIPSHDMRTVPIHRSRFGEREVPPAEDEFSFHSFPYDDFPKIESHLHPKFVICNSAQKLQEQPKLWYSGPGRTNTSKKHKKTLDMIVRIWSVWNGRFSNSDDYKSFCESAAATKHPRVQDQASELD